MQNKARILKIDHARRELEIEAQNQKILKKLVEIQGSRGPLAQTVLQTSKNQSANIVRHLEKKEKEEISASVLERNQSQTSIHRSRSTAMIENKMSVKNTLHSNYRKRELDKIEAENYKLAQKLFSLKSDLTKK